jgi:hypothetical protein
MQYFEAKKMTPHEVAVFMEERKWDYRRTCIRSLPRARIAHIASLPVFGFVAALLESIPILGLVFSISNRIGAAMWAFDLEKKQHYVREERTRERKVQ